VSRSPLRSRDAIPDSDKASFPNEVMLMLRKSTADNLEVFARKLVPTAPSVHGELATTDVRLEHSEKALSPSDMSRSPPRSSDAIPDPISALSPNDVMPMFRKLRAGSWDVFARKWRRTSPSVHGELAVTDVRLRQQDTSAKKLSPNDGS
jgi:hypothetical protein